MTTVFNLPAPDALNLLRSRRSGSAKTMGPPGPSKSQLAEILEAESERSKQIEEERARFLRAPVVVGVVSAAREQIKIPVWEQELSAGAACQNILIAAHALGFVANWLTEWYAYHPVVKQKLGLKPGERVAGFIYIGTPKDAIEERPRPDMSAVVT